MSITSQVERYEQALKSILEHNPTTAFMCIQETKGQPKVWWCPQCLAVWALGYAERDFLHRPGIAGRICNVCSSHLHEHEWAIIDQNGSVVICSNC